MNQSVRRLADIADTFNGKTPSKAEQRTEGFPVLKIKDISEWGQFRGRFESFVETSLAEKHAARWIRKGDALILNAAHNAAYVGSKMFLADDDVAGCLPTGEWLLVRPKQGEVVAEYLYYWLRTDSARSMIRFIVKGIHLYPKDVADMQVPWVPLSEQRRIVDLLSRAEGIVRLRREAEKKAAEVIPALFLDMFGDPATNPKGWANMSFGAFGECRLGKMLDKQKQSGDFQRPYLRNVNVQWDQIDVHDLLTMDFRLEEQNKFLVRSGDVLICEGGEIGRAAIWRGQLAECFYQKALHKLTPDLSVVRPDFIVWLLWHLANSGALKGSSTHATIAHLTGVQLKGLNVICPPIELQTDFEKRVDACHAIKSQQSAATAKAQAAFDALLASVFNDRGGN